MGKKTLLLRFPEKKNKGETLCLRFHEKKDRTFWLRFPEPQKHYKIRCGGRKFTFLV